MEPHVLAFGVTNLGVVLVPSPPNTEESQFVALTSTWLIGICSR